MRNIGPEDPREVGGYRILRVLGAGGMGRVYVGRSRSGRIVAVKVVLPGLAEDPGFRGRFRREVDAARRVGVTWTAPVLDADPEAEQPWLVTGYVAGLSLSEAVALHGPLPGDAVRTLSAGLAEALGGIHEAGVVHRDLKPSNVMLSLDGPRVIDFGISRAADASVLTRTGMTVGSPGFMSPEQIEGSDIGPPTDVFSLGAVLTFAATGAGPFGEGDAQALLFRILTQEPRLHALPEWLRPVIAACLAKNPADRPTPSDVLTAVAPAGGTSELVAGGWLPPDLITAVSRRAIALLELEDEPDGVPATAPDLTAADARKPAAPPITEPNPGAPPPLAPTSGDDAVRPEHAATVPVPPPTAGTVYVPPPPAPGGAPAPESVASTPPPTAFAPP
ncbi:MAG: protein kinase, partial [Streptomycetaceae bacterium]|nr:protein kinase [Streptomycetaceae bacterium]